MLIFNKSWNTGEVPKDWKKANVVQFLKSASGMIWVPIGCTPDSDPGQDNGVADTRPNYNELKRG